MLDISMDPARAKGTYKYRLTLEVVSAGIVYAEGTLRVEKLTTPRWPGKGTLSYNFGALALGKPRLPSRDQIFDLVVTAPQEWQPDDFEGTLWLGTVTASAGASPAKAGAKITGGFLNSKNGMSIALEDGDVFLETGISHGKKDKPKITIAAEGMVGSVSRSDSGRLDLSRPFVASASVIGNLATATHFCFGSSLLTPLPDSCCVSFAPTSWRRSTARLAKSSSSDIPTGPTLISATTSYRDFERECPHRALRYSRTGAQGAAR